MAIWYILALVSVLLTTSAQLFLKGGMSAAVRHVPVGGGALDLGMAALSSPLIWAGIVTMGFSLLSWMAALSRLEVSRAYPFTALGIVLTMVAGRFLFAESFSAMKLAGAVLIVAGTLVVARS